MDDDDDDCHWILNKSESKSDDDDNERIHRLCRFVFFLMAKKISIYSNQFFFTTFLIDINQS